QASITAIGNALYFVADSGIYQIIGNQINVTPISDPIGLFFLELPRYPAYNLGRSVGYNDIVNRRLLFYIPYEDTSNTDFCTANSKTLVYDYFRGKWFIWKNWHMAGGAVTTLDRQIYFTERVSSASLRRLV